METKTCKNCGADYHFSWGDDLCYGCVKDQHVTAVLSDQEFTGVPVEMANDAFANAYPTKGAEVNFQGYVLKENWEYNPKECIKCLCGHKHTVMEHAENVDRYAKAKKEIQAMKCNILLKPLWTPETQHCSFCFTYSPHSAGEHIEKIKFEMDTYSGHKEPNSINFPKTNAPIVSEIRPMTYEDRVEVEKRQLSSTLTKQLDAYTFVNSPNSDGIDDPAKASGDVTPYVTGGGYSTGQPTEHVNVVKNWWDDAKYNQMVVKEDRWMSMETWKKMTTD